tara:strand:+ start:51635 stop:54850 length:3216 start_codon:yes stop_codon:yes gene_type:complete
LSHSTEHTIEVTFTCYNKQNEEDLRKLIYTMSLLLLGTGFHTIEAQETVNYTTNMKWYREGIELFEKEKFSAAARAFENTQLAIIDKNSETYVNASYYKALCALNLFNKDAEYQLKQFVQDYPESPQVKNAYFQLGKYNYRKRKWDKVVYWFAKTDAFGLSNADLFEYNFRLGYAYFRLDQLEKAAPYFHELIDIESVYYIPANYYYAHISYVEGNFQSAINGFKKVENDKKFGVIIPYYISQIHYKQEQYDSLITYATPMLDNAKTKRKPEISKLVGDAYFEKKQYAKAIPYLQFFIKEGAQPSREEYFQLAFALLQNNQCEDAIKYFSLISAKEDELSQKAVYNMADCYLKIGNKPYARNAFFKASQMEFNDAISEESLLNYAKLSYEISYDPYTDAIGAFITYLDKYPEALKKEEAFDNLVNIYLSTNNYRSALASLENTKSLDPRLRAVYQQLEFNLAVEQFQNGNYSDSRVSFTQSQTQPENKDLVAQATYWIAESYYRQDLYSFAIKEFNLFLFEPRAFILPEFKIANYGIGYAYYQNREYLSAAKWFRKYLTYSDTSPTRRHDALLRTGDCYFISKNYLLSEEYYQKAFAEGGRNADYALYQYALTEGLLNKKAEQNASLEKLLADYPESTYSKGALYELGKNYMVSGTNDKAFANFALVINGDMNSPYRKKALEGTGLLYYNENNPTKALEIYKQIVQEYPTYAESKTSLNQIQTIYKTTGEIDSYEAYISSLDFMDISNGELDSLTYSSAEDFYLDNNQAKAVPLFIKYLEKFNHPIFANRAHFYLAESQYKSNQLEEALPNYAFNVVTNDPVFYYPSLKRAAEISYKLKQYGFALAYFEKLKISTINTDELIEMHWWSFKSASKIDSNQVVIKEGTYLLSDTSIDAQREAEVKFTMAKSYQQMGDTTNAFRLYTNVTKISQEEKSAESLYRMAEMRYNAQQLDSSEALIYELAQHTPTYADWLAKGLILLSDIYVVQEDYFQARTTLESIIANYGKDGEILTSAKAKLAHLQELENSSFDDPVETKPDDVNFEDGDNDSLLDELYEEEELDEEELPTPKNQ